MTKKPITQGRFVQPARCKENKPTTQSVLFCGEYINLSTISLYTQLSVSAISYIFSGKRQPSLKSAKKIAIALNMDLSVFVKRLEEHTSLPAPYLIKSKKSA